jgi:hypothetical protein
MDLPSVDLQRLHDPMLDLESWIIQKDTTQIEEAKGSEDLNSVKKPKPSTKYKIQDTDEALDKEKDNC